MAKIFIGGNALYFALETGILMFLVGIFIATISAIYGNIPIPFTMMVFIFTLGGTVVGLIYGGRLDGIDEEQRQLIEKIHNVTEQYITLQLEMMKASRLSKLTEDKKD